MYRKLYISVLMALALVSCSKQAAVGEVSVQMLATISPEMTVLVRGGGTQPEPVIADCAVLQAWRGDVLAAQARQHITPGTEQIPFSGIKLAAGVEYLIYIWVGCEGYYDTRDLRSVSVNGDKLYDGSSPGFDAFCSCSTVVCGQDDEVHPVTLRRPFAKLGFSAAAALPLKAQFSAPTTLNLRTGEVSGTRNVEYTVQPGASSVAAFDYIFAGEDVTQLDYTFWLGSGDAKTASVPLVRNKKTNILYTVTN